MGIGNESVWWNKMYSSVFLTRNHAHPRCAVTLNFNRNGCCFVRRSSHSPITITTVCSDEWWRINGYGRIRWTVSIDPMALVHTHHWNWICAWKCTQHSNEPTNKSATHYSEYQALDCTCFWNDNSIQLHWMELISIDANSMCVFCSMNVANGCKKSIGNATKHFCIFHMWTNEHAISIVLEAFHHNVELNWCTKRFNVHCIHLCESHIFAFGGW